MRTHLPTYLPCLAVLTLTGTAPAAITITSWTYETLATLSSLAPTVGETTATVSEFHETDTGLAMGVGFGVDVPLTSRLSLRPEFRTYSSVAMSRVNLGLHRGAIGVRYRW